MLNIPRGGACLEHWKIESEEFRANFEQKKRRRETGLKNCRFEVSHDISSIPLKWKKGAELKIANLKIVHDILSWIVRKREGLKIAVSVSRKGVWYLIQFQLLIYRLNVANYEKFIEVSVTWNGLIKKKNIYNLWDQLKKLKNSKFSEIVNKGAQK